jgi:hypothetical protein
MLPTNGARVGEVMRWYAETDLSLYQTSKAVAIAGMATKLGKLVGEQFGEGHGNAARHAIWQMMLTREFGADVAKQIGDIHADGQGAIGNDFDVRGDSWADQYNNAIAREIAEQCMADGVCTDEEMAALWMAALMDGTLITDKNCDERIPPSLRDCDGDGQADGEDCDLPPDVNPLIGPRLDVNGHVAEKADIDGDGVVTLDDVQALLDALGGMDGSKDQTGDCWTWTDDAIDVVENMD